MPPVDLAKARAHKRVSKQRHRQAVRSSSGSRGSSSESRVSRPSPKPTTRRNVQNVQRRYTAPAPKAQPGPSSRLERGRVQQYKRSPQYYRDYKAGEEVSQRQKGVRRAYTTNMKASQKTPAASLRGAAIIQRRIALMRQHDENLRSGSDRIARANYKEYTDALWKHVGKEYNRSKRKPKEFADYKDPERNSALAWVYLGKGKAPKRGRTVHLSPQYLRRRMEPQGEKEAIEFSGVPLHEWAHATKQKGDPLLTRILQNYGLKKPGKDREADAEIIAQAIARKKGMPYRGVEVYAGRTAKERRKRYAAKAASRKK